MKLTPLFLLDGYHRLRLTKIEVLTGVVAEIDEQERPI